LRDPHVVSLIYKVTSPETIRFEKAPPVVFNTARMKLSIADGLLKVEPKSHFASVDNARKAIDPFLRSWEVDTALHFGRIEIAFTYKDAKIVDRNPLPPGSPITLEVASITSAHTVDKVTLIVNRSRYPEPPALFVTSPDVESLWQRYQGYLDGHEPLLSMSYFCLSLLESKYRKEKRKAVADSYNISFDVLQKLGELTSEKGDGSTARKFDRESSHIPLTKAEINWVQESIKILIRRVGESSHVETLLLVPMADLPPL
jgi:hypothetical protein